MKQQEKKTSLSARILAGVLVGILLAGTVLGVLIYLV